MNKEREYIEPEILSGNEKKEQKSFSNKSIDFGEDFVAEEMNQNFSGIKQQFLLKGIFVLLSYIFGILIFFFLLFSLIFLIFDNPFDYILSAILLYFMIKGIFKMLKIFSIKK